MGEARYAAKLDAKIFDFMTIDAQRRKVMPTPQDWDRGTQLNMKEVRRLNSGLYAGQAEAQIRLFLPSSSKFQHMVGPAVHIT